MNVLVVLWSKVTILAYLPGTGGKKCTCHPTRVCGSIAWMSYSNSRHSTPTCSLTSFNSSSGPLITLNTLITGWNEYLLFRIHNDSRGYFRKIIITVGGKLRIFQYKEFHRESITISELCAFPGPSDSNTITHRSHGSVDSIMILDSLWNWMMRISTGKYELLNYWNIVEFYL